jgi:hypothetical protein
MRGARLAERLDRARAAADADDQPGPGPVTGEHAVLGGADHRDLMHVAGAEPEHRREHRVRPGEAPGHLIGAEHQVDRAERTDQVLAG